METKQVDPQAAQQEDFSKRLNFYLKKKNLTHVQENYLKSLAALEIAMEDDGVTYEDIAQNRGTEKVFNLAQEHYKHKMASDFVLRKAVTDSVKNKEWDTIETEFQSHRAGEQKTEETSKAYKEAQEQYKANPTPFNAAKMIKAKGISIEGDINGYTPTDKEQVEATHEAMRQKAQAETAKRDAEETANLNEMLNDKYNPQGQAYAKLELANKLRLKDNQEEVAANEAEAEKKFAEERQ